MLVISHNGTGGLLYRWGNPVAYKRGTLADRKLFAQHDAQWIKSGIAGAGHITVFNNGWGRNWSSVDEFAPPINSTGGYTLEPGKTYGPSNLVWTWYASPKTNFYSGFFSGAERLPNGNTLINNGKGVIFVVAKNKVVVWSLDTGQSLYKACFVPDGI